MSPASPKSRWILTTLLPLLLSGIPPIVAQPAEDAARPAKDTKAPSAPIAKDLEVFDQKVREMHAAFNATGDPKDPEWVKRKLDHMVEVNQYMRHFSSTPHDKGYDEAQQKEFFLHFGSRWGDIDEGNTTEFKELLKLHGWFTISQFGKKADRDAWLLVQHADRDRDFQREILKILEGLLEKNGVFRRICG